jgi:carboxypeptidase PM20D1
MRRTFHSRRTHPPFSGAVADGFVWGRGAMDVKVSVVALLEAATRLIEAGYAPRRTLLLAFGSDEEVGGELGAGAIAALLRRRGVELEVVVDEGTAVMTDGFPPLTTKPFALVGTAEKGYASVEARITSPGGHSSVPPIDSSTVGAIAGRLLTAVESLQGPPAIRPPVNAFLSALAPLADSWLASAALAAVDVAPVTPLLARVMAAVSRETAAMVRTTAAATILSAGVADNVLPQSAVLNFNVRLLSGNSVDDALELIRSRVSAADRGRVTVAFSPRQNASAASAVTPARGRHFAAVQQAVQEYWPRGGGGEPLPVLPFLLMGATDSKHYAPLSAHGALRFVPLAMGAKDLARVHGTNERTRVADYERAICIYRRTLQLFGDLGGAVGEAPAAAATA